MAATLRNRPIWRRCLLTAQTARLFAGLQATCFHAPCCACPFHYPTRLYPLPDCRASSMLAGSCACGALRTSAPSDDRPASPRRAPTGHGTVARRKMEPQAIRVRDDVKPAAQMPLQRTPPAVRLPVCACAPSAPALQRCTCPCSCSTAGGARALAQLECQAARACPKREDELNGGLAQMRACPASSSATTQPRHTELPKHVYRGRLVASVGPLAHQGRAPAISCLRARPPLPRAARFMHCSLGALRPRGARSTRPASLGAPPPRPAAAAKS
jgi:hypothetical protein